MWITEIACSDWQSPERLSAEASRLGGLLGRVEPGRGRSFYGLIWLVLHLRVIKYDQVLFGGCAYQPFDTICIYLYRFVSFDGILIDLAFRCLVCSACVV
jgi:hypothetical protein